MKRIPAAFAALKTTGCAAFIPYVMAGDPDLITTEKLMFALAEIGCPAFELGLPFSDPVADGPVIQAAGLRSLKNPPSFSDIFAMIARFRKSYPAVAIILMGYTNPVYQYGPEKFCQNASHAGADAIILVDVSFEERAAFTYPSLPLVPLVTPLTPESRLKQIVTRCDENSLIYLVGRVGITGKDLAINQDLKNLYQAIKKQANVPVILGFGVKTARDVADLSAFVDGVVMGSAFVDLCAKTQPLFTDQGLAAPVHSFISSCHQATRSLDIKG